MPSLPLFTVHDFINKPDETSEVKPNLPCDYIGEFSSLVPIEIGDSSTIKRVGYDATIKTARILFTGNALYEYTPIEEKLWIEFLSVKSKGAFFAKYIKSNKDIKVKKLHNIYKEVK